MAFGAGLPEFKLPKVGSATTPGGSSYASKLTDDFVNAPACFPSPNSTRRTRDLLMKNVTLRYTRVAAQRGDADAQNSLGVRYRDGQGFGQDHAQTAVWFQGVRQDYAQAVAWLRKAVDQGHAAAQLELGVLYGHGQGVEQDHAQTVMWYRKAAEQGYVLAQDYLGFMYRDGWGVERDDAQAIEWFRKAAEQGDGDAQEALRKMEASGRVDSKPA